MNNYEKDMYIDHDALEVECLDQPAKMVKYSTMLAEARRDRDQAKETLELEYAKIDKHVRTDPQSFNLEKATEGAIRGAVLQDKRYIQAQNIYNDANYEVGVLQGVVAALEQRKSMIEGLIKLHGQQYFAGPHVPHDINELREQKQQRTNSRINKHLKRTRNDSKKEQK